MCTFRKAIKNFEVKVILQKGASKFRGKFDIKCASFIALASMTYALGSNCYEPNLMNIKMLNDFLIGKIHVSPIWCPHVLLTLKSLLGFDLEFMIVIQNIKRVQVVGFRLD